VNIPVKQVQEYSRSIVCRRMLVWSAALHVYLICLVSKLIRYSIIQSINSSYAPFGVLVRSYMKFKNDVIIVLSALVPLVLLYSPYLFIYVFLVRPSIVIVTLPGALASVSSLV
jgi:hypothetical protein